MDDPATEIRPDVLAEVGTKGDFPAAARVLERLNAMVRREDSTTMVIAHTILKDPGLSAKVLRVVNSAFYRHGGDPVMTVSRAVILLGFDAIRDLAAGILLIEQLLPRGKAAAVRGGFARALRCGLVAQAVATRIGCPNPEEAYLLGLFENLGTLWLAAYYPDRFAEAQAAAEGERELEVAITQRFGVRPTDLAAHILEHWGFPRRYTDYFRDADSADPFAAPDANAKLSATVSLAVDYSSGEVALEDVLARFEWLFGLPREQFFAAARAAEQALHEQAPALGITLPRTVPGRRPADGVRVREKATDAPGEKTSAGRDVPSVKAILGEITQARLAGENASDILSMVLEGLGRTGDYDSVLLVLLNASRDVILGRLGFGEGVEEFLRAMVVPLRLGAGVLADAILSQQPRVVTAGTPADLVPSGRATGALRIASFIVCPVVVRRRSVGALLAARSGPPPVEEVDLDIVQLFSNHASLALDRAAG
jgi:eukaryotic-like serine/threonine-protein kinase